MGDKSTCGWLWHAEGAFNGNLAFDKTIGSSSYIFAGMTTGKAIKLTTTFQFPKEMEALKAKKDMTLKPTLSDFS